MLKNQITWVEEMQERFRTRNLKLHNQAKSTPAITSNKMAMDHTREHVKEVGVIGKELD